MKKIISLLLVLILMLSCGVCALASEEKPYERPYLEKDGFKIVNNVVYEKSGKSYKVIDFFATEEAAKTSTKIVIVSKIDSLPVTSIECYDTKNEFTRDIPNTTVKEIVLPDTIKRIGGETFCGFEAVEKLNIPKSLKYIGSEAFYNVKSLKKLKLPDTVTYIGSRAFIGMVSLEKFTFPSKIKDIPYGVLQGCKNLSNVKFKGKVKSIGSMAFWFCINLKSITIPKTVKEIGEEAFAHCKKLSKVVLKCYKAPELQSNAFYRTKKGIRFQVRTRAIAKQFKKQLKEKGTNKAKIYVGKKLIYKNITDDYWRRIK